MIDALCRSVLPKEDLCIPVIAIRLVLTIWTDISVLMKTLKLITILQWPSSIELSIQRAWKMLRNG